MDIQKKHTSFHVNPMDFNTKMPGDSSPNLGSDSTPVIWLKKVSSDSDSANPTFQASTPKKNLPKKCSRTFSKTWQPNHMWEKWPKSNNKKKAAKKHLASKTLTCINNAHPPTQMFNESHFSPPRQANAKRFPKNRTSLRSIQSQQVTGGSIWTVDHGTGFLLPQDQHPPPPAPLSSP